MQNAPEEVLRQQIEDELAALITLLEPITGLRSQWNGNVEIVAAPGRAFGGKTFSCLVRLRADVAVQDIRWPTMIHEAFHCFSVERNPDASLMYPGYEEGVVEALQRLYRSELLAGMNISIEPDVFSERDEYSAYTEYIAALEEIRSALKADAKHFYISLLSTSLEQRWAVLREQVQALADWQEPRFRKQWRQWEQTLHGDMDI